MAIDPSQETLLENTAHGDGPRGGHGKPQPAGAHVIGRGHSRLEVGVTVAGRYVLERCLGEGGMGAVYRAHDIELGRMIALKAIRRELSSNESLLKRFKQELLLSRQITHRNVIRIFDFIADGDARYITMELVDGEDLRTVLDRRGRLPIAETVAIVKQIAEGLQAAHSEGIIHRDLKPQNIMLDRRGQVRIMDFGLARSLEQASLTQTVGIMGTPDYMSPEQVLGQELDARSDIFSLGLILYEMVTGERAFAADSMASTLLKRTRGTSPSADCVEPCNTARTQRDRDALPAVRPDGALSKHAGIAERPGLAGLDRGGGGSCRFRSTRAKPHVGLAVPHYQKSRRRRHGVGLSRT